MEILTNTPIWVWCILLALVVLGTKQLQDRTVHRLQVIIAPSISLLLFIRILVTQLDSMLAMLMCVVGLLIGMMIGFVMWYKRPLITFVISTDISSENTSTNRSIGSWQQRGSFVPLLVYVYLFTLRYLVVFLSFMQEKGFIPKEIQQYFPDIVNSQMTAFITETIIRINALSSIGIGVLLSIVITMWLFERKSKSNNLKAII